VYEYGYGYEYGQGGEEIAARMQLIAVRTAQAFHRRKARGGAFWEDLDHATAVETGAHLAVGSRAFVAGVQRELGDRGRYRPIETVGGGVHHLREAGAAYRGHPTAGNASLRPCGA